MHLLENSVTDVDLTGESSEKIDSIESVDQGCRQKLRDFASLMWSEGLGVLMLRKTLQILGLCCGVLGVAFPTQAQYRFTAERLYMFRDDSGRPVLNGPDSIQTGDNDKYDNGFRLTIGGSFDQYDLEFIASQLEDWDHRSSGVLANPLVFDDTANNPVVVPVPPANTLAFTNSLYTAATTAGVEDLESERLRAGAIYEVSGSSKFQDYQINFGSNPSMNLWRVSLGWRQMRLNEGSNVSVTGVFDAIDTDDAAVAGDATDDPNNALSDGALTGAGYVSYSGAGDGYDAFDVFPGAPDTLRLFYGGGTENILNGVQFSGSYLLLPESLINLELTGRAGMYHNYAQGNVNEYLIGSVNDDSVYRRNFSSSTNGVSFGGSLGMKASMPITDYISLTMGYEALYVTNLAIASRQLGGLSDSFLGDRQYRVKTGDHLLLHGLNVGMLLTW